MARRLLFKENELSLSSNPPAGYQFIGYNGATFSEKQSDGDIVSISRSYKTYTALLTQSGSSAPTATVLENTIGNIVWARTSDGVYSGTLTGAFVSGKTVLFIQDNVSLSTIVISRRDVWIERTSANEVALYTLSESALVDSVLNNTSIEIRVYN